MGLQGLALSRLCYGSVALLVYLPLLGQLAGKQHDRDGISSLAIACKIREEARP
jgi:hypothetical protein